MQSPIDLDRLLQLEDACVEWKEGGDPLKIVRTLTAFANDHAAVGGGWVICGVAEEKDEHGFPSARRVGLDANRLRELKGRVLESCRNHVEPPILPTVHEIDVEEDPARRILLFYVPASRGVHAHFTKERGTQYWFRAGDRTFEDKGQVLIELLRRKQILPPFLDNPCPDASMTDIDLLALEDLLGRLRLPLPVTEYLKPGVSMEASARPLVVARELSPGVFEPTPTRLAILLFGREPARSLPGARVVLAVYDGTSRAARRSERFDAEGPLPKLLSDLRAKLRLYTGLAIDKSISLDEGSPNRPRYSQRALDEAIVNALVHRDYASSEPTRITIFSDRIEVTSPGGLVQGLDPERVKEGKAPPSWRNSSLAVFMLRLLGAAQNLGQGIPTIIEETLATAGKRPEINLDDPGWFTVVLPAFQPELAPSPTPPSSGRGAGRREGLILISIGGDSIRSVVDGSRKELGLEEADVLEDFASPGYVDGWNELARKLRDAVRRWVETPQYGRFHLFYRGPVVLAPMLGAIIAPVKPLVLYYHEAGQYRPALTLDRRFLIAKD